MVGRDAKALGVSLCGTVPDRNAPLSTVTMATIQKCIRIRSSFGSSSQHGREVVMT